MNKVTHKAFLDTNFLISLLDSKHMHNKNANDYFEVFLRNGVQLYTSTIAVAEYCVKGQVTDLPLRNLKVMAFDLRDAVETGKFRKLILENKGQLLHLDKKTIPDDTKLLAQAENLGVDCFVSADVGCNKAYTFLKKQNLVYYHFFDLNVQCSTNLGFIPNMPVEEINANDFFHSLAVQDIRKRNKI